ncbi:MAG: TetR/AcrR family transcriptional regulator [Deltaproteobacteria bacterium]|nr:TetR/AcrR family transcriptional regulator [Deltaproteobacteria bacterium]
MTTAEPNAASFHHPSTAAVSEPPRPAVPATARGQRTRRKLLDASEQVFGAMGYERASIVEITRTAGVAQGTFYVYFPSKKDVFVELVWDLNHRLRAALRAATATLDNPTRFEVERAGALAFLQFLTEHQSSYAIVRQSEFVDRDLFRDYYRRLSEGYRRALEHAMDAGQIRRFDPEAAVYIMMGILDFVGMRWVLWEGRMPPQEVIEGMLAFMRDGLKMRD